MRQAGQALAREADPQPMGRYLVIIRSLTPGARWKGRFSFLIVDVPASYQTQSSSRLLFGGNSPALILSSSSLMKGVDPILIPDPDVPWASCSIHSAIDFFGSPMAAFDTSSHASHVSSRSAYAARALGRMSCPARVAAADFPRPQASGWLLPSPPDRPVHIRQMRQKLLPELRVWFQSIRDL